MNGALQRAIRFERGMYFSTFLQFEIPRNSFVLISRRVRLFTDKFRMKDEKIIRDVNKLFIYKSIFAMLFSFMIRTTVMTKRAL